MKKTEKLAIISKEDNSLFGERETGLTHSEFEREYRLFNAIRLGDVETVSLLSREYPNEGIVMGNLSSDSLRQIKYWAVSTIAVAVHYAILGGLDETDAFNMSDEAIRYIDTATTFEEILECLHERSTDLTYAVFNAKANAGSSPHIRRCIHYIHIHLHEKITATTLADHCGLSRSYISSSFRKETGYTIHDYIMKEKMETAKSLLDSGMPLSDISYRLAFCSESHFISTFKKHFGCTPQKHQYSPGTSSTISDNGKDEQG